MLKEKIEFGAGNRISDPNEWYNHDIYEHRDEIDMVFDLNKFPYPLEDDSMQCIRAFDVLEHIDNVIGFMNECHRIIKPRGVLHMRACGWQNPNAWVDITHKRLMDVKSMDYFSPDTDLGTQYSFYTPYKWKILQASNDRKGNPVWRMEKIES